MNKNEKASVSVIKILGISLVLIFITGIGVMASSARLTNVKIILSNDYEMTVLTTKTKVADILEENHITLSSGEITIPSIETEIADNKTIRIVSKEEGLIEIAEEEATITAEEILSSYGTITEKLVTEQITIPFETITKEATGEGMKQNRILQNGKDGLKEVTYKIKYQNEIEIEMEFNLSGDIYQKREINMMIDLYGINYKTDFKNQTMYLEKSKPQVLKKVELENKTLIEDINQIYDQEYIIKNVQTKEEKTEVQIKATYLYSSFENETINKYETIITKELNAKYDLEKTKINK